MSIITENPLMLFLYAVLNQSMATAAQEFQYMEPSRMLSWCKIFHIINYQQWNDVTNLNV